MVDDVRNPRLSALGRYWNAKRDERLMPAPGDIDPVEIPRLLPIVILADALDGRIRLIGSEATAMLGREMRGATISDFMLDEFTQPWIDSFARVREGRGPVLAAGEYGAQLNRHVIEALLLPLSNDGETVDMIIGGLHIAHEPFLPATRPFLPIIGLAEEQSQFLPAALCG